MPQQRIHNLLVPMDVPDVEPLLPIDVSGSDDAPHQALPPPPLRLGKNWSGASKQRGNDNDLSPVEESATAVRMCNRQLKLAPFESRPLSRPGEPPTISRKSDRAM
jgi:hypothetical protein